MDSSYNYENEMDCWSPYDATQYTFPTVKGLSDINKEFERCKQEIGYYDELNENLSKHRYLYRGKINKLI